MHLVKFIREPNTNLIWLLSSIKKKKEKKGFRCGEFKQDIALTIAVHYWLNVLLENDSSVAR